MVTCNTTLEDLGINEVKLSIGLTFHHLALILCAVFGLISIVISLYLVWQHANHYSRPLEQKHIIRILFMIPVYSVANFLSLKYYRDAIYYDVLSDCYEAIAIASFFTLMCNYLAPNLHDQKDFFRAQVPRNWSWVTPIRPFQKCFGGETKGLLRKPRSGLTWFNIIWLLVFQYCFIRVFFTIVSVVTEAAGSYCEASLSPAFAHIWVTVFEGVSVTLAMVGLIQFYLQLKDDLAEHKPGLKILSIKLVIFFSFWQSLVISMLSSSSGPLRPTKYVGYQDIKNGIPALLSCIEMAIFSVLHMFAFPWRRPYAINTANSKIDSATPYAEDPLNAYGSGYSGRPRYYGGTLGWKAYADASNPWDIVKACGRGFRWLFVGRRHRELDSSYRLRNSIVQSNDGAFSSTGTKLRQMSTDAGVKQGIVSNGHDTFDDEDFSTTGYQGAGRFDDNGKYRPQASAAISELHGGHQQQYLAPNEREARRLSDSASDVSDELRQDQGYNGGYREDDYAGMSAGRYQEEIDDHRRGLLSNAAPSPTASRKAALESSNSTRKAPIPHIPTPEPLRETHPAFRMVVENDDDYDDNNNTDANTSPPYQRRQQHQQQQHQQQHQQPRSRPADGDGGGGRGVPGTGAGPGGSGWI